jgi:serine phosphatase RsbU (regulator of sigma subunit)/PAS domain-containing protein
MQRPASTDLPPGLSGLWIRSALAPPAWSRWWAAGVAGIAAVAAVEAIAGAHPTLGSAFAVVALLVGLAGERGDAIAVAVGCVAAAVVSGLAATWEPAWTVAVVVVAASSVAAVLVALLRATARTTARQLELLRELAALGASTRSLEALAEALLGLLVPLFADAALLDLAVEGHERRVGVRVAGPSGREAEEWLRHRRPADAGVPGPGQAIATGEAGLLEEFGEDFLRRIAADDEDLDHLRRIGARSLLTLPLATRGAPFGALTLLVGPSGRRYRRADADFARLVQGRMAIVLDNTGLSRQAERTEAIMVAALDHLDEAVTMNGPDGRTVYVNRAAVRLLKAQSAEELLALEPGGISARFATFDEAGAPVAREDLPAFRALAGEEHPDALLVRNVVRGTGEERWLLNRVSVLRDADGAIDRIVNVIEDVTGVKQAEVRQRLLGEATRVLAGDPAALPGVLVPELAAWCALRPAAGPEGARAGRAEEPGDARVVVPVAAGGEVLGELALGRTTPFGRPEEELAEELGRRAGVALLTRRLSEERAAIAHELQEGLRPPELPLVPGLELATLYRPAGELNDVGGDFYDAFPVQDGWAVCIGDVAGQGARAATLTGLTRHTLRSVAQHTGDGDLAVAAVNRALGDQPALALCTLALLRLVPGPGEEGIELRSLSAGHPLPILLRDGTAAEVGAPGPIAGVFDDAAWATATTPLRDGDTILLYTDGVPDTVGAGGRFGDARLLALLADAPGDPVAVVARIDEALLAFQAGPQRDDTAILAITLRDTAALLAAITAERSTA